MHGHGRHILYLVFFAVHEFVSEFKGRIYLGYYERTS
jgi:hypothetical protein